MRFTFRALPVSRHGIFRLEILAGIDPPGAGNDEAQPVGDVFVRNGIVVRRTEVWKIGASCRYVLLGASPTSQLAYHACLRAAR